MLYPREQCGLELTQLAEGEKSRRVEVVLEQVMREIRLGREGARIQPQKETETRGRRFCWLRSEILVSWENGLRLLCFVETAEEAVGTKGEGIR
jgi:hypothetical protein